MSAEDVIRTVDRSLRPDWHLAGDRGGTRCGMSVHHKYGDGEKAEDGVPVIHMHSKSDHLRGLVVCPTCVEMARRVGR